MSDEYEYDVHHQPSVIDGDRRTRAEWLRDLVLSGWQPLSHAYRARLGELTIFARRRIIYASAGADPMKIDEWINAGNPEGAIPSVPPSEP